MYEIIFFHLQKNTWNIRQLFSLTSNYWNEAQNERGEWKKRLSGLRLESVEHHNLVEMWDFRKLCEYS